MFEFKIAIKKKGILVDLMKEQLKKRKQMILNLKKEIKTLEST